MQLVGMNFGAAPAASALLPHIHNYAGTGIGHLLHGVSELGAAVATQAAKHIAGETFAMNAHKYAVLIFHITPYKGEVVLAI